MSQKKNDVKARSMLLMAHPNEHLLAFSQYKDAKTLFEAIQARFSGNDATKKTQRTLLKQMYENFNALSTESLNSIFNKLRKIVNLEQIHVDDLEEIDLKWLLALLSMRARSYIADDEVPTNMALMAFSDSEMVRKPMLKNVEKGMVQREFRPVWNNAMRTNHQNFSNSKRIFAPTAVLTKSGIVPISIARQSSSRAAIPVSAARPINTVASKPLVNIAKPRQNSLQTSHLLSRRPFYQQTTLKNRNLNNNVNTAKANSVNTGKGNKVTSDVENQGTNAIKSSSCWGAPQDALKDQGYFNSGCSRHMTGNISYPTDFKEHDGGYVAFGRGAKGGKITCKGTIRTGKLDFEDVYFVKELQFNIFSVSQICDKKNSVYFTDTECFVLSPNFKLADESQVLLKVPRKNNIFTWIFFLANKDETSRILKSFIIEIENLVEEKVKIITCDNETEFKNRVMNEFCKEKSTKREFSVARTPQQNGVAKRRNKTLIKQQGPYQLGKFNGKSNEGIFVGYSTTSKAFRVYNIRTRKVEENLHITFLENKPMIAGGGPEWLFDIDALSKSMSYAPVSAGTNSNDYAGKGASFDAGQSSMETTSSQDYILMPLWKDNSLFDSSSQASDGHNKDKHGPSQDSERDNQERPNAESSTKTVNTAGPVNTATPTYADYPNNPLMPNLEDAKIFDDAYNDRYEGAEADYNNLEIMEPKKATQALNHESWVEAIQEELLQFKLLNVWTLVDLPPGKRAIGTKLVYRNKRYQRGIVAEIKPGCVKSASTPMKTHKPLSKDAAGTDVDVHLYRSMNGSLMYLTSSRPDIMFAYPKDSPLELIAYSDRDYAGASLDRKSTTGGCQFLGSRLISWQCKKQTIMANSTIEAVYIAAFSCCGQVLWL
nr:hypothetical protein [Tanacetum cinerariifolium]